MEREREGRSTNFKRWALSLFLVSVLGLGAYGIYLRNLELQEMEITPLDDSDQYTPSQGGRGVAVSPTATRPVLTETQQITPENIYQLIPDLPQWFLDEIGGPQVLVPFGSHSELVAFLQRIYTRPQDRSAENAQYYFEGEVGTYHLAPAMQVGTIGYYHPSYEGKRTGFGDVFSNELHSFSSWFQPGYEVAVIINSDTGKYTFAINNDRGPNRRYGGNTDPSKYIADLSYAAYIDIADENGYVREAIIIPYGLSFQYKDAHPEFPPRESSIPSWVLSMNKNEPEQKPLRVSEKAYKALYSNS